MSKAWDNTILKKLKTLVGKGLSTSEIGKKLGLSKNAVVGKLHRMGWNAKAADTEVTPKTKQSSLAISKKGKIDPKKAKGADKKVAGGTAVKKVKVLVAEKKTEAKSIPKKDIKKETLKKQAVQAEVGTGKTKKTGGHAIAGSKGVSVHQRMVQHALEMAALKPDQCRWPIGDPDSENFHFCGRSVFVGKPYCYEHCKQAYQFTPPKKK